MTKVSHCKVCGGTGVIDINKCKNLGCLVYHTPDYQQCKECNGTGHIMESEKNVIE